MAKDEPTYRIDPIEPGELEARFVALLARLEPVLGAGDLAPIRILVERGDHAAAFARLDALTDDAPIAFETADLVELVLLGQASRST